MAERPSSGSAAKKGKSYFRKVTVYPEDVASAQPGQLFRSNVLAFYLEHLQKQVQWQGVGGGSTATKDSDRFKTETAASKMAKAAVDTLKCPLEIVGGDGDSAALKLQLLQTINKPQIYFLDTSVAQCMIYFNDPNAGPVADLLNSNIILIPVSEYRSEMWDSGCHWSLLRIFVERTISDHPIGGSGDDEEKWNVQLGLRGRHVSSDGENQGRNEEMAKEIFSMVEKLYRQRFTSPTMSREDGEALITTVWELEHSVGGGSGKHHGGPSSSSAADTDPSLRFPQQTNGYDCGAFVASGATLYSDVKSVTFPSATHQRDPSHPWFRDPAFSLDINQKRCTEVRKDIMKLLQQL